MCRRVECDACGSPTFAGCGEHVEQVLGDVPRAERCRCRDSAKLTRERPEAATSVSPSRFRGWFT
jgi:hypothetical protein